MRVFTHCITTARASGSSGAKSAATKEGATQPEQSGVETEVVEEEHDVALVVNWDVKPDLNLAQEYQKLKRPMYKKIAVEVDVRPPHMLLLLLLLVFLLLLLNII